MLTTVCTIALGLLALGGWRYGTHQAARADRLRRLVEEAQNTVDSASALLNDPAHHVRHAMNALGRSLDTLDAEQRAQVVADAAADLIKTTTVAAYYASGQVVSPAALLDALSTAAPDLAACERMDAEAREIIALEQTYGAPAYQEERGDDAP